MLVVLHENAELLRERRRAPVETIPRRLAPFCSRCVFRSPTLICVCSDNEHRGHTDGGRRTRGRARRSHRVFRAASWRSASALKGFLACADPTPTPRLRRVYFKQSYMNFPAVVKPACGPAGCLCAGDSFTDFSISAGLLWE